MTIDHVINQLATAASWVDTERTEDARPLTTAILGKATANVLPLPWTLSPLAVAEWLTSTPS